MNILIFCKDRYAVNSCSEWRLWMFRFSLLWITRIKSLVIKLLKVVHSFRSSYIFTIAWPNVININLKLIIIIIILKFKSYLDLNYFEFIIDKIHNTCKLIILFVRTESFDYIYASLIRGSVNGWTITFNRISLNYLRLLLVDLITWTLTQQMQGTVKYGFS